MYYDSREFPVLGRIYVAASEKGLCLLSLSSHPVESFFEKILTRFQPNFFTQNPDPFQDLYRQMDRYLSGHRVVFELSLDVQGTPFQVQVWEALKAIPYGETRSYGEIARAVHRPRAYRAVGQANHNNPVPIVVPCHRVIGSGGGLVGFGSGLPLKEKLLDLERITRQATLLVDAR
ncbi:MAG: methylated-DNA--[protein]-cysteine S-methyltransferase [Deltaproteobacteria bacterium]|nr:methylated-DNA--[protein]-cysteine S-methyltransferase [Deltaproteobacteria bacterium]